MKRLLLLAQLLLSTPALAVSTVAVVGGNILPDTQSPSGGVWAFTGSATIFQYTDPTNVSSGATPIPDSRFSTYVKFLNTRNLYGDNGVDGTLGEQANVAGTFSSSTTLTMLGFFRVENLGTNVGMLSSYGDQTNYSNGNINLSVLFTGIQNYMRTSGGGIPQLGNANSFWTFNGTPNSRPYLINQWQFIQSQWSLPSGNVVGASTTDDVAFAPLTCTTCPWPVAGGGDFTGLTFGSYLTGDPSTGADIHNYSGGLREWVAIVGTPPTPTELDTYRNGAPSTTPMSIWGGRVWGWWHFTSDPSAAGNHEPDASGNGHDLTYINMSAATGNTLPVLATQPTPYLVDPSGHFQLVSIGGGNYQIQTVPAVTSLPAIYGSYPVILIVNGYQFPYTLYVINGSL